MTVTTQLVVRTSQWLERRFSRRGFLGRVAVVGSAVAVSGVDYVLRPGTAYASVCGTGSSCASGWTAMCCTINNGVNQCPPGSFAGGWWKADGASLCGGKARYYIDCQAQCTRCGCGGGHFCGSQCWNCTAHCASGTCDERRVCWNVFRYGQCRQDISCGGPVLCRTISCTPPWKWEQCSTSAATDNRTVSHGAPCLSAWSPLQASYAALGSQGSPLGASVGAEYPTGNGRGQPCVRGRMYWSSGTGAHYLLGALASRYVSLREGASPLGFPMRSQLATGDARGQWAQFQHGLMLWTPTTGAQALWGPMLTEYSHLNRESGPLGYPTTTPKTGADGVGLWAAFERGGMWWSPRTGAHALWGDVRDAFARQRYESGPLGYPTATQSATGDGIGQWAGFEHGMVLSSPTTGAHGVWGAIYDAWSERQREQGPLGYPTSDVYVVDGGQRCDFEHGYAVLDDASGQVTVTTTP
jgi:uncharacterized protein with LGFP repeats